jgi:hypothetical protein
MSRSSIWRLLEEADLKPHRSVYWLNSHDPDFEAKAHDLCSLYLNALRFFEQGRMVICSDEKTGMQILQRTYPTQPMAPGKPEKREHEDIRHGVRALIASFVVATGQVVWSLGPTRTSEDFATHLATVVQQLPNMQRYDWVVDNLNTHWSLEVSRALCGEGPAPRCAAACLPERSDPYACLPLYPHTRLLAQPSGMVVECLGPSLSETRRLLFSPRL